MKKIPIALLSHGCPCRGLAAPLFFILLVVGCGESPDNRPKSTSTQPETTATTPQEPITKNSQNKPPLESFSAYLNGFHFYNGDMQRQVPGHHYVTLLNDEFMQAVIFDNNTTDAKLIGIEYIISERLYNNLPPEEKILWHSHHYEVKSGVLAMPGVPEAAENELMRKLISTYGKTWHTWHTDLHPQLPTGIPALMMSFTSDGQLNPELVNLRDQHAGVDTQENMRRRESIPIPQVDPYANAWERNSAVQLTLTQVSSITVPPAEVPPAETTPPQEDEIPAPPEQTINN